MKKKLYRLKQIRDIISKEHIRSQEELINSLQEKGVDVTQATLSRDLRELKVIKVPDSESGYRYSLPENEITSSAERGYKDDFLRGFQSIGFSGTISVIKTIPGHAHSVAFAIDNMELEEIVGTLAGDDTILVVLAEGVGKETFIQKLKSMIPELEDTYI